MNLKIRDVDPVALKKIDEMAKKKGISRQKFLKAQIEMLAFFQQQNKREMELENLILVQRKDTFPRNNKDSYWNPSGCGESLFHSLFLCLNLFLCVNTDKKEEKERFLMMGALKNHRDERVSVSVEELVPQDHFLRAIEATISFDFIEEKLRPYYCENNGRPSIHPIVLFKMMFIGYFYGIRSERQ
ncbi:transposase, partial [Bacillus thuringiensis]|uniref:transposase n=1 Tax=Bacillus thuringiensis TaxID=1428 RepID=UPI001F0BF63F